MLSELLDQRIEWNPLSENTSAVAKALGYGLPGVEMSQKSSNSQEPITYQYMASPWNDGSADRIQEQMLVFAVRDVDQQYGSTNIMSLAKVNQELYDAHQAYQQDLAEGDPEAVKFEKLLVEYGEDAIGAYHWQIQRKGFNNLDTNLKDLYDYCSKDGFCWLTAFGVQQKINFLGTVVSVTHTANENPRTADHFTQIVVCVAKGARVSNVFGDNLSTPAGAHVWLNLTRKPTFSYKGNAETEYGELVIVPGGSALYDAPEQSRYTYLDASKRYARGHFWRVGRVLTPSPSSPSPTTIKIASNTGLHCNEREANSATAELPPLVVLFGLK